MHSKVLFEFILFGLAVILVGVKTKRLNAFGGSSGGPIGNCSCGGFSTSEPAADSAPLLFQSPGLVTKCDEEGEKKCITLCLALATATKAKGPEILCHRLKDVNELKLSAFYKTCDKPWVYANMTSDVPLCCKDSKAKVCDSMKLVHVNATKLAGESSDSLTNLN